MKHLGQLIKEIIPVIIGILIALFINNWNEDRKDKKYLNQMFTAIKKELAESNADIKRVIPMQLAAVDTIETYLNNEEVSIYELMRKINGVQAPTIKTNSWNAIANSKIELIAYEQLSALAHIEEKKENLIMRNESQVDFISQNFEKTDKAKKMILRMLILDKVNAEKELQAQIEELIEEGSPLTIY